MIEKIGKGNSLTVVMTIANFIYAFSFLFKICFDIVLLIDKDSITQLQCESCKDGTAGYALLIFSENFI